MATDLTFLTFLATLGVSPEPGQEALARVAFDQERVPDLAPALQPYARLLFGDVDEVPEAARRRLATVAGARSGKTYLFSLRLLHLALTVDVSRCAPGEQPAALIVAPSKRLGRQALRYIKGAIDSQRGLRAAVGASSSDLVELRRGKRTVRIEVAAARAGGEAGRGFSLVAALMDEASFFRDEDYAVNDVEVWRAIKMRVVVGGQAILSSTPWARSGLLYDTFKTQWGRPETFLVAHAATRTMRTEPGILEQVADEERDDPDNARREFGAEFLGLDASTFFADELLERAGRDAPTLDSWRLEPGDEVFAGGDFGFRRNSSTLAIVVKRSERYTLVHLTEIVPDEDEALKPSEVCAAFAKVLLRWQCRVVYADQHYIEAVREHFYAHQIAVVEAPSKVDEPFVTARERLREDRLRLPEHRRLRAQLREVRAKPRPGGGLTILLPKKPDGSHGDLVSALVLATWRSVAPPIEPVRQRRPLDQEPDEMDDDDEPGRKRHWLG